ncbi:MAG TPA: flavin reductase family protein [Rhodospirillaceae bacterium]|nr:flavin reductase family protein [Rhodospirillaceae bacterium]
MDQYFYEPAKGHGLPRDPFKAIVAPRPIGWISSRDGEGRANLAPYSFFNAFCDVPPIVAFGSGGRKDSLRNIEDTGEFAVNFVSVDLAEAMNRSSAPFPRGVDEMAAVGLAAAPCRLIAAPRVADSPAVLECRLLRILPLDDLEGRPTDSYAVFGQVVGVHINQRFLVDGLFDTGAAQPLMRAGYIADYVAVGPSAMVKMRRPKTVEEAMDLL